MGAISKKFHRLALSAAQKVVEAAGGSCHLVRGNAGHGKMVIEIDGKRRTTPMSCTPRADIEDAIRMKICDVRRILREMGR